MYRIGIDIGGTKANIGLFNSQKELIAHSKLYIKDIVDPLKDIKTVIEELCKNNGTNYSEIASCGVGIPGTISDDGKRILKLPNISILSEEFGINLENELNIPVTLLQDSRAAAWGEYLCGGGKGANTVVCLTLGTGIGTGIILNGEIYNGSLGCAGEMGHIPAKIDGRECGCGQRGCVEKYCAGGGLDITAKEMYGEGASAKDLFAAAVNGSVEAKEKINEAINILGTTVVSIVNLLSPDCILFSGGLSAQEELYLNPLIDFVKEHCYRAEKMPIIKKAELGEFSPLYGAAFVKGREKRKAILSASIMCADILNLGKALKEIEEAGIEYLHCDIMDNHFVPNMMLPPELLNKLKGAVKIPFDYHIMAQNPESIIEKLVLSENDIVSVHYESTYHLQRAITMVKEKGAKASVAINPSTPISVLDEILPELDMVLIMSVNPGFAGQKIVPTSFDKIRKMRQMLIEKKLENILIQVDGNCSFENVPKMYNAGADVFVVGTSSVFKKDVPISVGTKKLKDLI